MYGYFIPSPIHAYMYLDSRRTPGRGFRYDVGVEGGWRTVRENNFLPVDGTVGVRSAVKKSLNGKGKKVAIFTFAQRLVWHSAVVGSESNSCDIRYSVVGTNCISWTVYAIAKAKAISKLKI